MKLRTPLVTSLILVAILHVSLQANAMCIGNCLRGRAVFTDTDSYKAVPVLDPESRTLSIKVIVHESIPEEAQNKYLFVYKNGSTFTYTQIFFTCSNEPNPQAHLIMAQLGRIDFSFSNPSVNLQYLFGMNSQIVNNIARTILTEVGRPSPNSLCEPRFKESIAPFRHQNLLNQPVTQHGVTLSANNSHFTIRFNSLPY